MSRHRNTHDAPIARKVELKFHPQNISDFSKKLTAGFITYNNSAHKWKE